MTILLSCMGALGHQSRKPTICFGTSPSPQSLTPQQFHHIPRRAARSWIPELAACKMTDKDKARVEKAKIKKENAMVIKRVNKRGKLSVQLGESSVGEYTSCLINLLTFPILFQFRNYAYMSLNCVSYPRQGGPGMRKSAAYPKKFAKKVLELHQNDSSLFQKVNCWCINSVIHSLTTALTTHMVHNPKCNNNIVGIGNQPVHVWIFLPKIDTICVFPLTAMPPVRSDCWGTIPWICSPSTWRCHQSSGSDQGSIGNEELTCFFFQGCIPKGFKWIGIMILVMGFIWYSNSKPMHA